MAFEQLNKTTERLADSYKFHIEKANWAKAGGIFDSLVIYYETTLQHAKFRSQRDYCKKTIEEINPSFAKGYFRK